MEKKQKAEERAKKAEERKKKTEENQCNRECKALSKQSIKMKAPTRLSDVTRLQSAEVSNNECAVPRTYEEDVSEDGEVLFS